MRCKHRKRIEQGERNILQNQQMDFSNYASILIHCLHKGVPIDYIKESVWE